MEPCIFCLEENDVITFTLNKYSAGSCECRINTHLQCWMKYITHKGTTICPICHKSLHIEPPPTTIQIEPPPNIIQIQSNPQNEVYQYRVVMVNGTQVSIPPISPTNEYIHSRRIVYIIVMISIVSILFYYLRD